ncbi:MAG: BMP family ABC transporter substrate-binding protein [Anaerovoracaceae bacterium]|jgi:basic membrane protein A
MKKIFAGLIAAVMVFALTACGTIQGNQNKVVKQNPLVVLVTNTGSMGDNSYNDEGWVGCEQAKKDMDIDIRCLESQNAKEVDQNLQSAGNDNAALVVVMEDGNRDAIKRASVNYPDTKFVVIDGKKYGDNVAGVTFAEQEGAYLAGIAAASVTITKTVGFIGGKRDAAVQRYEAGFKAGVMTVEKDINVLTQYTGNYSDTEKAASIAEAMHKRGADVIMQAAGKAGAGVIETAGKDDFYAIGTDADQSVNDSEHVLCSATKDISGAVKEQIAKVVKGDFQAKDLEKTIKDDSVGISDNAGNMPQLLVDRLDRVKKEIIKGKIKVPWDSRSLANFKAPDIEE